MPDSGGDVRVKICGIVDPVALATACEAGADWVGFVFFARSPRSVTAARAATLLRDVGPRSPQTVGLFVRASDDEIARVLDVTPLDILQIYDTPERAMAIRAKFRRPVWLACGVATRADLPETCAVDGMVIESRAPLDADRPGGNARSFDWSLTARWPAPAPWLLAGGLTPENVAAAIATSGARAVDVSSGVEDAPGRKNPGHIRNFIQTAKGTCHSHRT